MLSKLFCRFLFQLFLNKCKGKSKSHIAFLKICNCLFDRLRSCIHVKLLKIVSHLIKFCGMMLVMLQHVGKKCYSLILAVTALAGTAVSITVCMTMVISFRMAVCMAVSHTVLMGVLMCMFMAVCMSMLNKIAILIFD